MSVLTDLRNGGIKDVFFVVREGLKGRPEVVGNVWPQTIVQTCIIGWGPAVLLSNSGWNDSAVAASAQDGE